MTRVVSFGSYTFPSKLVQLDSNFGDGVPRTQRLPGMDGGYDEFGDDPAPTEIGRITLRLRVAQDGMDLAAQGTAMQALRDGLRALVGLGRQVLTVEPSGGTATRWTYARANYVQTNEKMPAISDRLSDFTIDLQCADPHWYSDNAGSGTAVAAAGTATDFTLTNGGNARTVPVVALVAGTAALPNGVTLRRLDGTAVKDQVAFAGTVAAGGTLVIDARALAVTLNGADAYGTAFAYDHPAWLRLLPGDNDYRIVLGAGEAATVTWTWDDAWY